VRLITVGLRSDCSAVDAALTMPLQEFVELLALSDDEFTGLDSGVVDTQDHVNILHRLCANISEFLDLGSRILDLIVKLVSENLRAMDIEDT
jgi:hypothetical protein